MLIHEKDIKGFSDDIVKFTNVQIGLAAIESLVKEPLKKRNRRARLLFDQLKELIPSLRYELEMAKESHTDSLKGFLDEVDEKGGL